MTVSWYTVHVVHPNESYYLCGLLIIDIANDIDDCIISFNTYLHLEHAVFSVCVFVWMWVWGCIFLCHHTASLPTRSGQLHILAKFFQWELWVCILPTAGLSLTELLLQQQLKKTILNTHNRLCVPGGLLNWASFDENNTMMVLLTKSCWIFSLLGKQDVTRRGWSVVKSGLFHRIICKWDNSCHELIQLIL